MRACRDGARPVRGFISAMPGSSRTATLYLGDASEWGEAVPQKLMMNGDIFEVTQSQVGERLSSAVKNALLTPGQEGAGLQVWDPVTGGDLVELCIDTQVAH